jgi:hypothetical protein
VLLTITANIVLVRGKGCMFEVKMLLRFIQSLFYPPQAVDVDGVDLLDDVSCLLKNLLVLLLVRRLGPLFCRFACSKGVWRVGG